MKIVYLMLAAIISMTLSGADNPPAADQNSERSDRPGRSGRGGRGNRSGRMLEQLKEKYPNEVAEIEKLQKTDPTAARDKMFELMRKSNMFPGRRGMNNHEFAEPTAEQLAEIKSKHPEEFAEYEKVKASDPEKAKALLAALMKKTFGDRAAAFNNNLRDRNRRSVEFVKAELKRRYPERYAQIEKLAKTDPDAAREELRKLFAESNLRIQRGARSLNYEYVDPKLQQQFRPGYGMPNSRFGNQRMNYGGGYNRGWRR